jgi:hypothetical protein
MKSKRPNKKKLGHARRVLRLPDLDHAKTAVLNTLLSFNSQRAYRFAMDDFIAWYCSEPRLAFNKTVVPRYKLQLESRHLASSTINLRLAAVRRLAYEAADTGLSIQQGSRALRGESVRYEYAYRKGKERRKTVVTGSQRQRRLTLVERSGEIPDTLSRERSLTKQSPSAFN